MSPIRGKSSPEGNQGGARGDYAYVDCRGCREALSARLDGEDRPAERTRADDHLASCSACRDWLRDADALGRMVRAALPVPAGPGIPDTVLDAAPGQWRARVAHGLRWVLGALGAAQFVLGVTQIASLANQQHTHAGQLASAGHLWHESAAWNLALGAGFVFVATRRTRPVSIVPLLTVFVGTLGLLSLEDVFAGHVQATWLLSHGFILAGYAIIVLLSRPRFDFGGPPAGRGIKRWTVQFDEADSEVDRRAA
jgi:predicted anti-sigma-YlaC factor YlaD